MEMGTKLTKGELISFARSEGIDPDQSYEDLREAIDIKECQMCDGEFVYGWSDKFCSDACEAQYINTYH